MKEIRSISFLLLLHHFNLLAQVLSKANVNDDGKEVRMNAPLGGQYLNMISG